MNWDSSAREIMERSVESISGLDNVCFHFSLHEFKDSCRYSRWKTSLSAHATSTGMGEVSSSMSLRINGSRVEMKSRDW